MTQYATIAETETYLESVLSTDVWDDAIEADQTKALKMATRIIDRLPFSGDKTDDDQTLEFPRNDETDVPVEVQYACIELALVLLDDINPDYEYENLRLKSQGISSARVTYDVSTPEHVLMGVPSISAWRYLKPYIKDLRSLNFSRVS